MTCLFTEQPSMETNSSMRQAHFDNLSRPMPINNQPTQVSMTDTRNGTTKPVFSSNGGNNTEVLSKTMQKVH